MGRQSNHDKKVIDGGITKRPEPPDDLSERAADIWRQVVASEPLDWFQTGSARLMLCDYCRYRESLDMVQMYLDDFPIAYLATDSGVERYTKLIRSRDVQVKTLMSLATKLRITTQSRYDKTEAGAASKSTLGGASTPAPWESSG